MKPLNLAEFTPLPHNPAYLVHPDGRVISLKKQQPMVLSEKTARRSDLWRVRIGHTEVRVRDLVFIMFGTTAAFLERAEAVASEVA